MKTFKLWISIVLTVIMFSSCSALKTPVIVRNAPIEGYRYVFITPTKELTSSTGGTYGGQYGIYGASTTKSVNPSDVISGELIKNGFVVLPELKSELNNKTLIVNYGESGRRKINQYTRYLTICVLILQAPSYLFNLKMQAGSALNASIDWNYFIATSTIILAAGSMFILWLGERITDKGIGNGVSLIIMIGIIARLPQSFFQEVVSRMADQTGGLIMFLIELIILVLVIAAAIMLVQGVRKVPVQYAKRIVGNRQVGGARQYLPLKVNAAGVMPIIFAQAIMFIPLTLIGFSGSEPSAFMNTMMDHTSFWYNLVFAVLIIVFTYFYTAITVNPTQMADQMKANNGFIPGIKPGKATVDYLDAIMDRITLPGSIFLALIAIMPAFAGLLNVKAEFAQFFGGTSLLILVGVVLDTLQQIESHLLMRHYDGLLKSGRIKGRNGGVSAY